jgi:hypothetical protein
MSIDGLLGMKQRRQCRCYLGIEHLRRQNWL